MAALTKYYSLSSSYQSMPGDQNTQLQPILTQCSIGIFGLRNDGGAKTYKQSLKKQKARKAALFR